MDKETLRTFFAVVGLVVLALVVPAEGRAQVRGACEGRPAIGGAMSLWTIPMGIDPALAGAGGLNGLARGTGPGIEGSIQGVIPVGDVWSVTGEFGAGRRGVEIYRLQDGTEVRRDTGDALHIQRFTAGVMMRRQGTRIACVYLAVAGGPHRFSYRGGSATVLGGAIKIGVEVPTSDAIAIYVDMGINAIFNVETVAPLADPVLAGIRPTLGVRYRF